MWRDPDRRSFAAELDVYHSPHDWDRIDKSLVQPLSDMLALRVGAEAINVNSLDEVADSSWYDNRLTRSPFSPEQAARGPCGTAQMESAGPFRVVNAKTEGASAGFVFETEGGDRYLAKLDGGRDRPRASLAEVLASRIYHAAGFHVPCYLIVNFNPSLLQLAPEAKGEDEAGREVKLTQAHLEEALRQTVQGPQRRRIRAVVSRSLEGRPLGPFRYHGVRPGDRNDIVRHEDRRELRGSRLLAAWTDHVDQREGNSLSMWRETAPGRGYVMHHLIDFGDCFGSIWRGPAQEAWRHGHDYWLDPRTIVVDWLTLGLIERPWDNARLGPTGFTFGYYDVEQFDPEHWRARYPNPAFSRMTEHDAAWMARIIARITPEHLRHMLRAAAIPKGLESTLEDIVLGRREKILRRYLLRLSPLAQPVLRQEARTSSLCLTDLSVSAGVAAAAPYTARYWVDDERPRWAQVSIDAEAHTCVRLPQLEPRPAGRPAYVVVELAPTSAPLPHPIQVHLYAEASSRWLVAGIDRLGR